MPYAVDPCSRILANQKELCTAMYVRKQLTTATQGAQIEEEKEGVVALQKCKKKEKEYGECAKNSKINAESAKKIQLLCTVNLHYHYYNYSHLLYMIVVMATKNYYFSFLPSLLSPLLPPFKNRNIEKKKGKKKRNRAFFDFIFFSRKKKKPKNPLKKSKKKKKNNQREKKKKHLKRHTFSAR